jgi:hypothetical protein
MEIILQLCLMIIRLIKIIIISKKINKINHLKILLFIIDLIKEKVILYRI